MQPKAAKSSQKQPKAAKSSQKQPKAAKCSWKHPKTDKSIQKKLQAAKSNQEQPKAAKCSQMQPNAAKCSWKHPKTDKSKSIQKQPKAAKSSQKQPNQQKTVKSFTFCVEYCTEVRLEVKEHFFWKHFFLRSKIKESDIEKCFLGKDRMTQNHRHRMNKTIYERADRLVFFTAKPLKPTFI